jgi:hypothetical protein
MKRDKVVIPVIEVTSQSLYITNKVCQVRDLVLNRNSFGEFLVFLK